MTPLGSPASYMVLYKIAIIFGRFALDLRRTSLLHNPGHVVCEDL